jgi:hypothetical protein
VQAARAHLVSLGYARPLAPNPSYSTGESLEDPLPRVVCGAAVDSADQDVSHIRV